MENVLQFLHSYYWTIVTIVLLIGVLLLITSTHIKKVKRQKEKEYLFDLTMYVLDKTDFLNYPLSVHARYNFYCRTYNRVATHTTKELSRILNAECSRTRLASLLDKLINEKLTRDYSNKILIEIGTLSTILDINLIEEFDK